MPIKKEMVAEHVRGMNHYFTKRNYKMHSYLAVPEMWILKEGEGTPVDLRSEAMDASSTSEMTVATGIALESKHSTTQIIKEQAKALQESEEKNKKAENEKLAKELGLTPDVIKAQQEQYKKLERQQLENEQKREACPVTAASDSLHHFASGQQADLSRRHATSIVRQTSKEQQATQVNLKVGTAVELVDPPGYGTIRWIGKFPGVDQDISGVEMVSCTIYCLQSVTMFVLTLQ